jgi:hypothetical protein
MAWDEMYRDGDHLLFGSHTTKVDLAPFHPETVHIFRLWQTFLDNVNPLLKVVHGPTMQASIIEIAGNVASISPSLEALMFSIYCTAVLALAEDDCVHLFGLSKEALLVKYRFGCQQALSNCKFLRSADRDTLTALFLYLVGLVRRADPVVLSDRYIYRLQCGHARSPDPCLPCLA